MEEPTLLAKFDGKVPTTCQPLKRALAVRTDVCGYNYLHRPGKGKCRVFCEITQIAIKLRTSPINVETTAPFPAK